MEAIGRARSEYLAIAIDLNEGRTNVVEPAEGLKRHEARPANDEKALEA